MYAAESPVGGGDAFDECALDRADGFELGVKLSKERVEVGRILRAIAVTNHDVTGEDVVFDGVARGSRFPFGGSGTGGPLGVATVGGES